MFDTYLDRWNLILDGSPIVTHSGHLLPVRRRGEPAMLKLATEQEERFGGVLMEWWNGDGAARVLALDADALLLERAEGTASLAEMARNGRDDEACRILRRHGHEQAALAGRPGQASGARHGSASRFILRAVADLFCAVAFLRTATDPTPGPDSPCVR